MKALLRSTVSVSESTSAIRRKSRSGVDLSLSREAFEIDLDAGVSVAVEVSDAMGRDEVKARSPGSDANSGRDGGAVLFCGALASSSLPPATRSSRGDVPDVEADSMEVELS